MSGTVDPQRPPDPEASPGTEPGVARGATTLSETVDRFAERGYVETFQVLPERGADPRVRCLRCHTEHTPQDLVVDDAARLEGASDPDEMMLVVAVTCPACRALGTLTLGYGPMASAEDADVLGRIPLDPHHLGKS